MVNALQELKFTSFAYSEWNIDVQVFRMSPAHTISSLPQFLASYEFMMGSDWTVAFSRGVTDFDVHELEELKQRPPRVVIALTEECKVEAALDEFEHANEVGEEIPEPIIKAMQKLVRAARKEERAKWKKEKAQKEQEERESKKRKLEETKSA